jgi:hypothetical protein
MWRQVFTRSIVALLLAVSLALFGTVLVVFTSDWFESPEVRAAAIGAVATALTAAAGVLAIIWQIGEQARHTREETKHSEGLKLRLDVYRDTIPLSRDAQGALGELNSKLSVLKINLAVASQAAKENRPWTLPSDRLPPVTERQSNTNLKVIRFLSFVENWQFLVEGLDVFQNAFGSGLFDLMEANRNYNALALRILPMDKGDGSGTTFPWRPPAAEALLELERLTDACAASIGDLMGYVSDFRREMQYALLNELFSHVLPVRQPIDPAKKVVRLEDRDALNRYFLNESPAGRDRQRVMEETRKKYRPDG